MKLKRYVVMFIAMLAVVVQQSCGVLCEGGGWEKNVTPTHPTLWWPQWLPIVAMVFLLFARRRLVSFFHRFVSFRS